jgi:bifunctional UDP-N-acetylglucosamine pyrophosphorylase/glucosamine-1-phosphate N-acetyltransferase
VGAGAIIAAGTTVTKDVPADALVIARVPQVNRAGWAARRRALATQAQVAHTSPANASKKSAKSPSKKRR